MAAAGGVLMGAAGGGDVRIIDERSSLMRDSFLDGLPWLTESERLVRRKDGTALRIDERFEPRMLPPSESGWSPRDVLLDDGPCGLTKLVCDADAEGCDCRDSLLLALSVTERRSSPSRNSCSADPPVTRVARLSDDPPDAFRVC
jgi:hypothetical protein